VLSRQIGSISNIQQLVRQIGDKLYLRKDGIEDYSNSPTQFNSIVNGKDFRQGAIGGSGWGIYKDGNGNTIGEFDKLIARKEFVVNNLIINQASYIGGIQINSAAAIECSKVEDLENEYKCYFDQKQGSVVNLFKVDDIAYCQSFFLENNTVKYYKRKVVGIGDNYILLSKAESDGNGIPSAGDNIIHFGNYSEVERQYVIIRDVVGGGYERMLSDLNSVNATGVEYFFAGRMNNGKPRWFVGDKDGEYAEWVDGKLKIKGTLEVGSDVGGATVVDGGLVTAETISLGSGDNIKAGTTGKGDSDEDIRFWAGSTFEDRANAPFRVLQDGSIIATKGVFIDAQISGKIIDGLTVSNDDSNASIKLLASTPEITMDLPVTVAQDGTPSQDTYSGFKIYSYIDWEKSNRVAVLNISNPLGEDLKITADNIVLSKKGSSQPFVQINNSGLIIRTKEHNINLTNQGLTLDKGNKRVYITPERPTDVPITTFSPLTITVITGEDDYGYNYKSYTVLGYEN
jgi:hypothetical protein